MERAVIDSFLDRIADGSVAASDVAGFVKDLNLADLSLALSAIRARIASPDGGANRGSYASFTAGILLEWAVLTDFASEPDERIIAASAAAAAASEIFMSVLGDDDSAAAASLAAGMMKLDPAALADAYERFGAEMATANRIRLLRLLAGCGDPEFNRRYGPALADAMAAERNATPARNDDGRGNTGSDRDEALAAGRAALDDGSDPDVIDTAVSALEKVLEMTPRDEDARKLYLDIVGKCGLAGRGQAFLVGLSSGFHDGFRTTLLLDAAALQVSMPSGHAVALATLESAVVADPTNAESQNAFMRAAIELGETARAARLMETVRASVAGKPAEMNPLIWQGRLLAREGRDDDAEKVWRRIRAIDTRCVEALDFYVGYYARRSDWQKQFSTLQFELSILDNDEDRVRVNREMADVAANRLNKLDKAAEAYKRILAIVPGDDASFDALVDILEKSARWNALVELYNERIRRLPADDVDAKVSLLFRIVDIYQDPDKQPSQESMLAAYSRISDISPKNRQAIRTLEAGYESSERWPDLLKVLQRKVDITDDPAELLDLFHRISEIAINRMSNETQAIPFLEKILELDPQNLDVVKLLKTIYGHKHNQERQYAMLRRELEMVGPGPEREPILLAAAEMARDRLLRPEDALALYEETYRLNGRCREARENLHTLYNRLERWDSYAKFLNDEVDCQMPTVRRIELLHKLGEIRMDHLGDIDGAAAAYGRVLEIDPGDEVAANRLERIFIERGEFERIYDVYKGRGEVRRFVAQMSQYELRDARLARDLSLVMARVCAEDLNDPGRALDHLEDAFIADPASEDIGRRVIDAATARNDRARVERTLRVLAANGATPAARQADYMALHDICLADARTQDAFDAIVAAIDADPGSARVPDLVAMATETAGNGALWQPLAKLLHDVAAHTGDMAWRQRILMDLGGIYLDRLLFVDDARAAYEGVLEIAPDDRAALDRLEQIVIRQEDYDGLEGVLQRRLSLTAAPDERQDVHMRLARLYEDLLGDDEKAAVAWSAALEDGAEPDRTALGGLHRTLERLEQWDRLADTIRIERGLAAPGWDRSRLDCELAAVLADGLGNVDEALGILDGVLSTGRDEKALEQVVAIFDSGRDTALAGSILQSVYQREGETENLLRVLETRLERTTDVAGRAALLVQISGIRFTELGDAESAFRGLVESVQAFPTEENVRAMVDMAAGVDGFATAADALELIAAAGAELDPSFEAWISRTLGELYGRRLGNPELAITAMERALPFEEDDPAFLAELLSLYRAVDDTDSAMAMFTKLAAVQTGETRRSTLIERSVYAAAKGLFDEAVQTLRTLAVDRFDPEVDEMLEDLLEEHGRFADLISHLVRKAAKPEYDDVSPAINARIASIYLDRMKLPGDAARYIELAVAAAPDDDAFVLFAESMVADRSLRNRGDWAAGLAGIVHDALSGRDGVDDRLLAVLKAQAELASTPADSAACLRKMASVECGRGNFQGCYESMAQALAALPDDAATLPALIDSARRAGACDRAVTLMMSLYAGLDADAGAAMGMAAARMALDDLGDAAGAVRIYRELSDRYPDRLDVLSALDGIYRTTGADAERVGVLVRIGELVDDDARRSSWLDAATISVSLGDNVAAAALLKRIVDSRPDDFDLDEPGRRAAVMLVEAASATQDWDTAADMQVLLGTTTPDENESRDRQVAAADIIAEKVGDGARALSVLLDVLRDCPSDRAARDRARELARRTNSVEILLSILDGDVRLAGDDADARIVALLEIARVQGRPDVGNQDSALEALEGILLASPNEARAIAVLREFFDDPEWDMRAADVAMTAATASGDRDLLIDVLRVRIRRAPDGVSRAALLREIGENCVLIGRDADALDAFGDAFAELPLDPGTFDALLAELVRQNRTGELVGQVRRASALVDDVTDRCGLRDMAAGKLAAAGENAAAIELLQDVLMDMPGDRPAIEMTLDLARAAGDWERYAAVMRQAIDHVHTDPDALADVWLECAEVHWSRLNDQSGAIECYREVLKVRPLDRKAIDVLATMLEQAGDTAGLRALWKSELDAMPPLGAEDRDDARAVRLLVNLADSSLSDGLDADAVDATMALLNEPAILPATMDAAMRIFRKLPEPALFDALTGVLQQRGENRRLLDIYRFGSARHDMAPGQETCLRAAIDIEEKLRLHDFRFEDLGRLVEIVPGDVAAVDQYVDAGRKLGRMQKVAALLERAFAAVQDSPGAYDLALMLADILEKDLGRAEDASAYLRLAFLRRPEAADVVRRLSAIYTDLGRFGELALLHENLAELTADAEQRIRHYFDAFEVLRTRVQSPDGAAEVLKKVLDLDPVNTIAVENLEAIARETGNIQELAVWIGHRAELSGAPAERRRLRVELAGILEAIPGRRDEAIAVYDQLVDEFPQDEQCWGLYEKSLIAAASFEALADMYMRMARGVESDAVKLAALKKAASVFEARLGDTFAAISALQAILAVDPADDFAFERLSGLLEQGSDFDNLVKLYRVRADATAVPNERMALNLKIATIMRERLGRAVDALECYREVISIEPANEAARLGLLALVADGEHAVEAALALEKVFIATGEHERLIDILDRQAAMTEVPQERADLLIRMASVQAEGINSPEAAVSSLGKALAEVPGSLPAFELLLGVAERANLWRPAYEIVAAAAAAAWEDDDVRHLRRAAGDIAMDRLADPECAATHYAAFLLSDPDDPAVLERLDALYGVLDRRDDQIRILKARIAVGVDGAATPLRMRLAEMLVEDSRDLDGAFEIVRAVLAAEPANQHAIGLMTALSGEPLLARRATDILRRAYLESGDNVGLLQAVESQIESGREVSDLIEMHRQAAVAAARLGMTDRELQHLGAALALDPADDEVLAGTVDAIGRFGDGNTAWQVLNTAARAASWPDLEKKLLLMAVDSAAQLGMDDFSVVEPALRRVLEIDPVNRPAMELLDAAYTRDGRAEQLVGVLRHRLKLDLPVAERSAVIVRIASIHEGRGEWKQAAEAFEDAVALGASDESLLKRLRACYRETGNVRAEIETVERMARTAGTDAARFDLLLEISAIQERDLRDVRAARATVERIIAVDEFHAGARVALERIYGEMEDWESLTRLLNYAVESDLPVDERLRAALKAASIAGNEAGDVTLAISFARKAAQIDPGSADANDELLRLYFQTEDWTSLIGVMRRKAAFATDPAERVHLLSQAATIARDSVHDNALAAMIADEILAINPDHPEALLTVARVREVDGRLDDALEMYRRLAGMAAAPDLSVEAWLGVSRVLGLLGAPEEEVGAALKEAASIAPDHPSVKGFLKQVYIDNREFDKVMELLERSLADAENDGDRAAIAMEIAGICRRELGDGAGYVNWAEKAWAFSRNDPAIAKGLVDYHLAAGDDAHAVPYLEWLVNYLEAKRLLRELPPYAHQMGRILEAAGDTRRAVEYYRICHETDATNTMNSLALARLHIRHNELEKATRVLQALLLRIDSLQPAQKAEVLLSLARINVTRNDPKKARQFVTRLLSEQPDCAEAREMLSRL